MAWAPLELVALMTVGLLPARLRAGYGLAWGPGREALLAASTVAIRGGNSPIHEWQRATSPACALTSTVGH